MSITQTISFYRIYTVNERFLKVKIEGMMMFQITVKFKKNVHQILKKLWGKL